MTGFNISVKLEVDANGFVRAFRQAGGVAADFGKTTKAAGAEAGKGFDLTARGVATLQGEMQKVRGIAVQLLGVLGGLGTARRLAGEFIRAADAMAQMDARLKLVSGSSEAFARAQADVIAIARAARGDLESVAALYTRLAQSSQSLGLSQAELGGVTEAVATAMTISGGSAQSAAAGVQQLAQAFGSGVLSGDEFKSVMESSPRVVQALTDALGVNVGQLRKMAEAQELTAQVVGDALLSQLPRMRAELEALPPTLAQATTQFRNAFALWADEVNRGKGITGALSSAIAALADNINALATAALLGFTLAMGHVVKAGSAWVLTAAKQALAARAASAETLRLARAEQTEAAASLQSAQAAVARARAQQQAALATGMSSQAAAQLAAALQAEAAAAARATAATEAVGAASAQARSKILTLDNAINAAVAALVGWQIGNYLREEFLVVEQAGIALVAGLMKGWESLKAGGVLAWEAIKAAALGAINVITGVASRVVDVLADVNEATDFFGIKQGITDRLRQVERQLQPTTSGLEAFSAAAAAVKASLDAAHREIDDSMHALFEHAASSREAKEALKEFEASGRVSTRAVDAALEQLRKSLSDQDAQMREQVATFGKGRAAAIEYAQGLKLAAAENIDDAAERQRYIDGVKAAYAPLIANAQALDALSQAQQRAGGSSGELAQQQERIAAFAAETARMLRDADIAAETDALVRAHRAHAAAIEDMAAAAAKAGIPQQAVAERAAAMGRAFEASARQIKSNSQALEEYIAKLRAGNERAAALAGLTAEHREIEIAAIQAVADAQEMLEAITDESERARQRAIIESAARQGAAAQQAADAIDGLIQRFGRLGALRPLDEMTSGLSALRNELDRVADATADTFDPARAAELRAAIVGVRQEMLNYAGDAIGQGIASLKSLASEGSKAYKALELAQTALNLASAIGAIANQGMGDPYTAFARIAAMAALMSQFVKGLGSARGGLRDAAAQRQAAQGTGSVLGDSAARSESIARATEITARATEQLVGINRGMLTALQGMQAGLRGASALIARDAGATSLAGPGQAALSRINQIGVHATNLFFGGMFGGLLNNISRTVLGARSRITDTGIVIGGGLIEQLMQGVQVGAYQESQSRSWWGGRTRTNTQTQGLGDDVARQFQRVVGSMVDAVRGAAQAIGLDMQQVNAAIAAFRVEEARISTHGLSAEQAQAEINAVFSRIFDGLAGHVAPFVAEFQEIGEGLAETLVRVATGVQVTQEGMRQLGFALAETDPQRFARASESLMQLAGGVEQFASGMATFVNAFAPEARRLEIAGGALTTALAGVGLALPATREGMWQLMQSLDATTEAGRSQIATLLRLAGVADQYYRMQEERARRVAETLADNAWRLHLNTLSDAERAVAEINREYDGMRQQLEANGATAAQLAELERQRAEALQQYRRSIISAMDADIAAARIRLSERGMSEYAREQARIARETNQAVAQAQAAGASAAEILTIRLKGAERAALAAAEAMADFASELADWEFDDYLAGLSEAEQARARENRRWQERYNRAVELYGADSEEAARVMELWGRAIRRVTDTVRQAAGAIGSVDVGSVLDRIADFAAQLRERLAHLIPGDGMSAWLSELSGLPRLAQQSVRRPLREVADLVRAEYLSQTQALQQQIADAYRQLERLPWDAQANREIIEGRIRAMQDALASMTGGMEHALDELRRMYLAQLDGIRQYLDEMLLNTGTTTLTPEQQLTEAQRQYEAALAAAQAGDTAAIQQLPQLAQRYLELARGFWSSGDQYQGIFDGVRGALQGLLDVDFAELIGAGTDAAQTAELQLDAAQEANALLARIADNLRASNSAAGIPAFAAGGWVNGPTTLLAGEAGRELILPNPVAEFFQRTGIPINRGGDADMAGGLKALRDELRALREERKSGDRMIAAASAEAGQRVAGRIEQQTQTLDRNRRELAAMLPRHR